MTLKRARSKSLRAPFLFPFLPQHPPPASPIFFLSGGFFGGKVPKSSPDKGVSSCKRSRFPPFSPRNPIRMSDIWRKKSPISPLPTSRKPPRSHAWTGENLHKNHWIWVKSATFFPEISPYPPCKSGRLGEWAGIWLGIRVRRMPPWKGKMMRDLCGGMSGRKMSGKVAEIEFFRFSKAAIFRQAKGQNPQTSGSFYFRRSHSNWA